MDSIPDHMPHCHIHKSMLSCLESVVTDIHVDLSSIDTEVNNCLPSGHQLPSNIWTPPFFKDTPRWSEMLPVVTEVARAHLSADQSCASCVPKLPSILLTLEREMDRHVQYVNYVQEKMNAIPASTSNTLSSTMTSRTSLMRTQSVSRSKIRTNPSLPVLQRSPKVLNLSQEFYDITSVSQQLSSTTSSTAASQNSTAFQNNPPCLCCDKCVVAFQWFSDSVCSKIQYLKDQCEELQTRLLAELKEKEKELMVQLAQKRKAKQTVSNNFSRLQGLRLQGLAICSNILAFEPVCDNQSRDTNQSNTRYAADGQSCDEESTNQTNQLTATVSMSVSSEFSSHASALTASGGSCQPTTEESMTVSTSKGSNQLTATESMTVSMSEGSYSLPQVVSFQPSSPTVIAYTSTDVTQMPDNIYDEPVTSVQRQSQDVSSPKTSVDSIIPDSPMPELLEFQRKRSNSLNQYDKTFNRDTIRRRSNTISHPVSATAKQMMNASGPYTTIQETAEETDCPEQPALLHVKSDIAVTFPDIKPRKMKKSKSSIMVRATKLKNFIAKKFKRKSWNGTSSKKSLSPTSVQASSTGVQFFEYDFSDDGDDHGSVNATSDTLADLSTLTGTANTLSSPATGTLHTVIDIQTSDSDTDMNFTSSHHSYNSWLRHQIATIEKHLNDSVTSCLDQPDNFSSMPETKSAKPQPTTNSFINQTSECRFQLILPTARPTTNNYNDFLIGRSSFDSLSTISVIQPDSQHLDSTTAVPPNSSCSDPSSTNCQPENNTSDNGSSRKRLMFDDASPVTDSIYSFHDDSSFDVHQGYASFRKLQKIASTPRQQPAASRASRPLVISPSVSAIARPDQGPELLNHLCLDHSSLQGRQNMEKLCHVKPYLLQGHISTGYLLDLIRNYPRGYRELPGYNPVTMTISIEMTTYVSSQTSKPHIFARNLVWRLFTLLQLYGGKSSSGQNTESLDENVIMAVRNATFEQYSISNHIWQYKCVTFIHQSINYLFNRKLRSPVFRALLQHSDC